MSNRLALVGAVFLMIAAPASADTITLTSGSVLHFDFEGNGFYFYAPGFSAVQYAPDNLGVFFLGPNNGGGPGCDPCAVGETWDPSFTTTNTYLGTGSATFAGMTYSAVAFYGDLNFGATPITMPEIAGNEQGLQSPFAFTGTLRVFEENQLAFSAALSGIGNANRYFYRTSGDIFYAGEERLSYNFTDPAGAQTPEPASLLLLGTGIAGVVARRRHWHG